ncbi:PIN domain-like protein [Fomes fomentarius]|nr:PIN domain-like protein [Fomes fomentarius]
MGVLGLTPFLQKSCPHVVKHFPERLQALSGKRIVIDGTLITQRFHFAPMPQPYRHVLSWYRLARHLRDHNIQAICTFDGKLRSLAKEREIERRRKDRMMTAARGGFEYDRLDRLRRLSESLRAWHSIGVGESERELESLKRLTRSWKMPANLAATASASLRCSRFSKVCRIFLTYWGLRSWSTCSSSVAVDISNQDMGPSDHQEGLAADVSELFTEYCKSIPQLVSLSETTPDDANLPDIFDPPVVVQEDPGEASAVEYAMSKTQQSLIYEEAQLWAQLAESVEAGTGMTESVSRMAESLEAKSNVLSESYMRRTHPPTAETYKESKEILRAMGIPCIEPSGPYEAEALAAAVVLSGHADLVASEDTDVLIYDAPLVRNLGSRQGPLLLISGAEVREVLELNRDQFIDFALLLGTDFSQRIKNVGPARALKYIRKHGSIEQVLEHETKYPPRIPKDVYLEQVQLARSVFHTLPPIPDIASFEPGEVDEEAVLEILDKHGLRRYGIEDIDYSHTLSGNYFADNPAAA